MSFRCDRCPAQGRCSVCRNRNAKGEARRSARTTAEKVIALATEGIRYSQDAWLLHPDDKVIDRIAVSIAVYGERRVRLTYSERVIAAKTLLRHGSDIATICLRLSLPYVVSEDLTCRMKTRNSERNTAA